MKTICGAVLLSLMSCTNSIAVELERNFLEQSGRIQLYMAYAEFKMGHHEVAHAMWSQIEGSERAEALFNLAILYEQGLGVDKDMDGAISLYQESANMGSRASAFQLGLIYRFNDRHLNQDQSRYWLEKAASQGDQEAAQMLADSGDLVSSPMLSINRLIANGDYEKAVELLRTQVDKYPPNPRALARLAWLFESGVGVQSDLEIAADLFERAADLGNAEAQYALSVMYETGKGRAKNSALAQHWLDKAKAQELPKAVTKSGSNEQ